MAIQRPYFRTARPFSAAIGYRGGGFSGDYLRDPRYADGGEHYWRAFQLLCKDMVELFDYVEPSDDNETSYSYRIHALLQRACMEVEANLKAILVANRYPVAPQNMNMGDDYRQIDMSHRLSAIQVEILHWQGRRRIVSPFERWGRGDPLPWYQIYNRAKHDRMGAFTSATLGALVESVAGCAAVIAAQFVNEDFSRTNHIVAGGAHWGWNIAGPVFEVRLPRHWREEEQYGHPDLALDEPFQIFPYPGRLARR